MSTMLRSRKLEKKGNRFELTTKFTPSEDEILDQNLYVTGCVIVFDFTRSSQCINVCRIREYSLPSLTQIQQEIIYMFQLFNSLSPYETSSQKSQD